MKRARSIEAINASCVAIHRALSSRPDARMWLSLADFQAAYKAATDPLGFRGGFDWSKSRGLTFQGRQVCVEKSDAVLELRP